VAVVNAKVKNLPNSETMVQLNKKVTF